MVDPKALLADLKKLRRTLEADVREQNQVSEAMAAVNAEWREAFDAKRTADTFETFLTAAIDQSVVHWILAVVFLRFLEDNGLLDRPLIAGLGERLELAQARQAAYVRLHPLQTDTDYLLQTFAEAAELPGLAGLYDPVHNPLFRLPLSGDGAMALLAFFRARAPETGALNHDFTDPNWDTRFLGDLYQDLSELARKRYALLQTPEFVETWILDRTLVPAMREFGATKTRMIDPTCGSGHFLLGGFDRILTAWRREAPDMPPAAQAQRALDAVAGVDLNPFAVEIARFRLLLAALRAAGETRLAAAPDFKFQLAVGDSLLHGRHFGLQGDLAHHLDDGYQRRLRHHFASEDTSAIEALLGRQYHAVVGNPPYITPKDPAMRDAYREIYASCHGAYGLGVPFIERFFDIALTADKNRSAGFVGLIVANSFMKREFGARLIEHVLPRLDVTHIVDCSGAYIPGHGTPTVILFGRHRGPVAAMVRTVRGIRGEPGAPSDPAKGRVWSSIVAQTDLAQSVGEFVSTEDTPRDMLARHPWNMGGGGAADLQTTIEHGRRSLSTLDPQIGFASFPGADDVFIAPAHAFRRASVPSQFIRKLIIGELIRDYEIRDGDSALTPYDKAHDLVGLEVLGVGARLLWPFRTTLAGIVSFGGKTKGQLGDNWWSWYRWIAQRYRTRLTITFAFVATHNHFTLDRGGKVFNRSAPVIKLPAGATEDDHLGLIGLLNTSTACFWLKQVFHNKGSTVDEKGARQRTDPFEDFYEFTGTGLQRFPLVADRPVDLSRAIDDEAQNLASNLPAAVVARRTPTRESLNAASQLADVARSSMIALQEELDWRAYELYGLIGEALEHPNPPPVQLGERAFEIVMARQMAEGELETAWFSRHGSTPIVDLPAAWPAEYQAIVERRIAWIESDPAIGLIERPEFKRRWAMEDWVVRERDALRGWLLDRLENSRYWPRDGARLTSTSALADASRRDADFQSVAALYAGRDTFDLEALVAELVTKEAVPFLSALRYRETGLRKRADWEVTWEMQRQEDAVDAELAVTRDARLRKASALMNPRREGETETAHAARVIAGVDDPYIKGVADEEIAAEAAKLKKERVGNIPVPPKYRTPDFLSTDIWRLRGGLDAPKERFVSFPHCARDADGSLPALWAGYDHLARAKAIAAAFVERKDIEGWPALRLIPLLTGLLELVPWLRQWHNGIDPETGLRMGDYFAQMVEDEARELGLTPADLKAWTPPATARRTRGRRPAA